jgi:fatty-acyl-CoA synthase
VTPAPLTWSHTPADTSAPVHQRTVGDLLRQAAADAPRACALVDGVADPVARTEWTYAQLLADCEAVARALLGRFAPGERVLVVAPNSADWVLLQMGAALAGLVLATANPGYRDRELAYVLSRSGAVGVIVADEWRGHDLAATLRRLSDGRGEVREILRLAQWPELIAEGRATDTPLPVVRPADVGQIQYTGGTTGFPKGVLLHHRGMADAPELVLGQAGLRRGDTFVNVMPLFHVGGCVTTGLGIVAHRGTHVVAPEFTPGLFLELAETFQANVSLLVPTMLLRVLEHPDLTRRDVSSIHTIMSGAAPVPAELIRTTKRTFGCQFTNIFGQTEVCGVVTTTTPHDSPEDQAQTIGRAVKQVEIKIGRRGTGEILPIGEEGEICARGHQMMAGYLDDPAATAATIDIEDWLHTGDLGSMDARGYVRITGRLKEMIIRGGENVSPAEVEEVLYTHPAVAEAVVLGLPHPEWGEEIGAVVRLAPGRAAPDAGALREHCRAQIARFKAPSRWFFVDGYPTTAAGKVQKFVLRERIVAGELVEAPLAAQTPAMRRS